MRITWLSLFAAVVVLAVHITHLIHSVIGRAWCHQDCFGPYLFWSPHAEEFLRDSNPRFRRTFSLQPGQFGENFGGLLVAWWVFVRMDSAVVSLVGSSGGGDSSSVGTRLLLTCVLVAVALFACLPFAGALGVVAGFVLCALAVVVLLSCVNDAILPAQLTTVRALEVNSGSVSFPKFTCPGNGVVSLKWWTLGSFVLVALNNLVHVLTHEMKEWCHPSSSSSSSCVGPWLVWKQHDSLWDDANLLGWGSVFSLDVNRVLQCWTPILLLVLYGIQRATVDGTVFCLVLALFGAFGYGGNAGILLGLNLSLLAAANLVLKVGTGGRDNGELGDALLA